LGPLQGLFMLLILLPWARYIDRRPLSEYGVSANRSWVGHLLGAFVIVVGVWSVWHALAASLGRMRIDASMTGPQESTTPTLPFN